jgi:Putative transposase, YhgA-like
MAKENIKRGFDADFDTFWKEMLDLVEPAVLFFLPDLHAAVDWSEDYKSLEQELRTLFTGAKIKVKKTDKLFRLKMKDSNMGYLFLHIEVEAYPRVNFPARVFSYFSHIYIKNDNAPITILVIFVGDAPKEPLDTFKLVQFGTSLVLHYNTYTIAEQSEEELMASNNMFALLVLANLYVIQSRGNPQKRFELKKKFLGHLNKKGISLDKFRVILNFALYLVKLTPELDHDFEKLLDKQYNLNAKDMTGKQKVFEHNKKLIDIMTSAFYGEAASDLIEKTKEAEREMQKAEIEMQKAEQRAVWEQQEKYKILKASVLQFSEKMNLSPAQIAEVLQVDLTHVLSILKDYKI